MRVQLAVNALTPSPANTRILQQITQEHIGYMLAKVPRGRFVDHCFRTART